GARATTRRSLFGGTPTRPCCEHATDSSPHSRKRAEAKSWWRREAYGWPTFCSPPICPMIFALPGKWPSSDTHHARSAKGDAMRFRLLPFVMLAAIAIGGAFCAAAGDKKVDKRVFELRIYHVNPGKMSALHARFRDRTNKLLEKHGMTLVGFWTPT